MWCTFSYFYPLEPNVLGMGKGNGNLLQYSCLENPVDKGAAVHRVARSQTWLKLLCMHACIGEGNGNPLQYSCLENPRDRGAWWAAVCGVAQTQLKRLSNSSVWHILTPLSFFFKTSLPLWNFPCPLPPLPLAMLGTSQSFQSPPTLVTLDHWFSKCGPRRVAAASRNFFRNANSWPHWIKN